MNPLNELVNHIGLAPGSDIGEVKSFIASLQNKLKARNDEYEALTQKLKVANESQADLQKRMQEMQNELATANDDCRNKQKAIDDMKNEMGALNDAKLKLEKDIADIEAKGKEDAYAKSLHNAKEMVQKYVDLGKISAERAEPFIQQALANFALVEATLEALPTNFAVPKPATMNVNIPQNDEHSFRHYLNKARQTN